MSENYIVINGQKAELTEEQLKQLGIKVKKRKRWRADIGDYYWFVKSQGTPSFEVEGICPVANNFKYYSHNYFQTMEEAETYARVLETEMLLKKYADQHNEEFEDDVKYCLYFADESDRWGDCIKTQAVHSNISYKIKQVWFSSRNVALQACKEIGIDRIGEYLIYEW